MSPWTTDLPSEPGWYWVRIKDWTPWIAAVSCFNGKVFVDGLCPIESYCDGDKHVLQAPLEWAGPLSAPECV